MPVPVPTLSRSQTPEREPKRAMPFCPDHIELPPPPFLYEKLPDYSVPGWREFRVDVDDSGPVMFAQLKADFYDTPDMRWLWSLTDRPRYGRHLWLLRDPAEIVASALTGPPIQPTRVLRFPALPGARAGG